MASDLPSVLQLLHEIRNHLQDECADSEKWKEIRDDLDKAISQTEEILRNGGCRGSKTNDVVELIIKILSVLFDQF